MKISGTATLSAPLEQVWNALLDPDVLVRTIPGCERLEEIDVNHYSAAVMAGVGAIKGTFAGKVQLSDLKPHESLLLRAEISGAPGTVGVDVQVRFTETADATVQIDYDADAVVGGMIGGVGQRMLTSVSKRMANEFFGNVDKALAGEMPASDPQSTEIAPAVAAASGVDAPVPAARTFGAPAPTAAPSGNEFLKGALTGAAIALLGVVFGAIVATRR